MTDWVWRDAAVTYPDWSGNAQLDQRRTGPDACLEEVVGLDPDRWLVVGIDIGGGESFTNLRVVAFDRFTMGERTHLSEVVAANNGEIPVTEFLVHNVDPWEVLQRITHSFEMRLRRRGLEEVTIRVTDLGDTLETEL